MTIYGSVWVRKSNSAVELSTTLKHTKD